MQWRKGKQGGDSMARGGEYPFSQRGRGRRLFPPTASPAVKEGTFPDRVQLEQLPPFWRGRFLQGSTCSTPKAQLTAKADPARGARDSSWVPFHCVRRRGSVVSGGLSLRLSASASQPPVPAGVPSVVASKPSICECLQDGSSIYHG